MVIWLLANCKTAFDACRAKAVFLLLRAASKKRTAASKNT
jgi:hypothetical protein